MCNNSPDCGAFWIVKTPPSSNTGNTGDSAPSVSSAATTTTTTTTSTTIAAKSTQKKKGGNGRRRRDVDNRPLSLGEEPENKDAASRKADAEKGRPRRRRQAASALSPACNLVSRFLLHFLSFLSFLSSLRFPSFQSFLSFLSFMSFPLSLS